MSHGKLVRLAIDFGRLSQDDLRRLCGLYSHAKPTPGMWVMMTTSMTEDLYRYLKRIHIVEMYVSIDKPYVITIIVHRRHMAKMKRRLKKYLQQQRLRLSSH